MFPRCNLACTPCYHSRDANRVATDGSHTRASVLKQMKLLQQVRGTRAHAQLIGGEVSLLPPDDHFETLQIMREHGREPMSMSHGDFDYGYLQALTLDSAGRKRLDRVSFAGHFDMSMFGRRGLERPNDEASLNPYRKRFADMFIDLRRDHGVKFFLAHTMTVTPRNVDQIADVVRSSNRFGYGMFSFQPAAFVGDDRRWHEDYRETTGDDVWAEIEKGAGCRLPFKALQLGDERCNRTTYGFYVGDRYFPILDEQDPRDLKVRDTFLRYLAGLQFSGAHTIVVAKLLRVVVRHPSVAVHFGSWASRMVRTVRIRNLVRHRVRPVSFVMHSFMDAEAVKPAWAALQAGEVSLDPQIAEAQDRLRACSYSMAHPETGEIVPACVQHSVLDPGENIELRRLLPIAAVRSGSESARKVCCA